MSTTPDTEEIARLQGLLQVAIHDLREADETVWHDRHTTLADYLAVQVEQPHPCPLLHIMAGERAVLPEAF